MRLLLSWVRDFVDVNAPADRIAEMLALCGFEVASLEAVGDGDAVIDLEVTANRPDCLSVIGLAREIATATTLPLQTRLALGAATVGSADRFSVVLEDEELCPRYAAVAAEVTPAQSPSWMKARLQAAGVRPISPIVDITNYVLMELGHPTHAFDRAKLAGGELHIRRARQAESLMTLDGVERRLEPSMLVIADAERPQAIAGVMGGAPSEVSELTRTVV